MFLSPRNNITIETMFLRRSYNVLWSKRDAEKSLIFSYISHRLFLFRYGRKIVCELFQ